MRGSKPPPQDAPSANSLGLKSAPAQITGGLAAREAAQPLSLSKGACFSVGGHARAGLRGLWRIPRPAALTGRFSDIPFAMSEQTSYLCMSCRLSVRPDQFPPRSRIPAAQFSRCRGVCRLVPPHFPPHKGSKPCHPSPRAAISCPLRFFDARPKGDQAKSRLLKPDQGKILFFG